MFRRFAAEGRHVIVSSHVLHEVDIISDRVILLSNGYVVAEGQIRSVREEIEDHPMQVLIRCDKPRALASEVFQQEGEMPRQAWLWNLAQPLHGSLWLMGAALGLHRSVVGALDAAAIGVLLLIVVGIHNAWVVTLYLARRTPS